MKCLLQHKFSFSLFHIVTCICYFQKGMRDWVSYISKRYSKANNKYLKSADPKQESNHIIYLDANNLYGYAISKFLLTSRFKWIDCKEFDLNKCTSISSKDWTLIVNLKYPKELRELRKDYPFALDEIEIKLEVSNCKINIADFYNIPIGNVNYFDKEKHVLHYENFQLDLRVGLKLKNTLHIRKRPTLSESRIKTKKNTLHIRV